LVRKPEGKVSLTASAWNDNIQMYIEEMKWEGMDWIYLAQERSQLWALVNMVMNSPVLSRKFIVKLISYFRFSRTPF